MKRRSFLYLLGALAGLPALPKVAAKPVPLADNPHVLPGPYYPPIPVGTVQPYMGHCPLGWLPCDGRWVSRNQFPELGEAIGTPGKIPFQLPRINANILDNYDQRTMNVLQGQERYMQMQYIIKT